MRPRARTKRIGLDRPAPTRAEHGRDEAGLEVDAANDMILVSAITACRGIREPFRTGERRQAGRAVSPNPGRCPPDDESSWSSP